MNLSYQKYYLTIEAEDQLLLPYYKGSTFRGAFGSAFRRVICALRRQDCSSCMLKTSCIYAYVFETAPDNHASIMGMDAYTSIPHPFVIEPPLEKDRVYEQGGLITFGLILIGRAVDYLPYFVYTFEEMGKTGLGKKRGRYRLVKVAAEGGELIYAGEERIIHAIPAKILTVPDEFMFSGSYSGSLTVSFVTPARISYGRRLAVSPDFHILIRSLLRRLSLLHYFHVNRQEAGWEHKRVIGAAETVGMKENQTRWWDWERYSTRQKERMKMGGFVGEVTYEGIVEPFLPILEAGELFHVGKGTSFGLGKYTMAVDGSHQRS